MKERFLEKLTFDTIFSHIEYRDSNEKDTIRVQIMEKIEPTTGYIIGNCHKYNGDYYPETPASPPYYDDYEPAMLLNRKRISYWVVATEMNKTYLVPIKED